MERCQITTRYYYAPEINKEDHKPGSPKSLKTSSSVLDLHIRVQLGSSPSPFSRFAPISDVALFPPRSIPYAHTLEMLPRRPAEDALFHWPIAFELTTHRLPRWQDAIAYFPTPPDRPITANPDP
ncbi:MAG: hypothetical protein GY821_09535, partial [Gammaproteobacteria bacterium]|nr:hypothetical protein [Gammaproteobacteria bacterium]